MVLFSYFALHQHSSSSFSPLWNLQKYLTISTPYHTGAKIWTIIIYSPMLCLKVGWQGSVDPDETPHPAASHLGLHCLLRPACPNTYSIYDKIYHTCAKIWRNIIYYPLCLKIAGWLANSADSDETPRSVASHLGLHCLFRPVCLNTYGIYRTIYHTCD